MSLPELNAPVRIDNLRRTPTTVTCTLSFCRLIEGDEILDHGDATVERDSGVVTLDRRLLDLLDRLPDAAAIALRNELHSAARACMYSTQPSEQAVRGLALDE